MKAGVNGAFQFPAKSQSMGYHSPVRIALRVERSTRTLCNTSWESAFS
jgi:hypothetical protein